MSDWEDLCGDMGWANDEQAFDKLIDFVEKKAAKPHPKYYGQEFTPEQKRAYAIKKMRSVVFYQLPLDSISLADGGRTMFPMFKRRRGTKTE